MSDSVAPFYAGNPAVSLYHVLEGEAGLNQYLQQSQQDSMKAYEDEDRELSRASDGDGPCADTCCIS
eukprot:4119546-Amphidinium_carterae.1